MVKRAIYLQTFFYKLWFVTFAFFPEGTFNRTEFGSMSTVCPSSSLSVCPVLSKSCPLINFNLNSPRLTFLGTMNGHDP